MRANRRILIFAVLAAGLFLETARPLSLAALPPEPMAWAGLVKAMEQNPESDQTRDDIRAYLSNYPESANRALAIHMLAEVGFRRMEFRTALAGYEECLARHPETNFRDLTFYRISECRMNLGEAEAARQARVRLMAANPDTRLKPEIEIDQALELLRQGDLAAAKETYAACAKKFPWYRRNARLLEGLAWIAFKEQRHGEVVSLVNPAEAMTPFLFCLKGQSLMAMGDTAGTVAWLHQSRPEYRELASGLLMALIEKGRYEAAADAWRKMSEQAALGGDADTQFLAGYAQMRSGRFAEAKKTFSDYLKNPRGQEKTYAWYLVGVAGTFLKDPETASAWTKLMNSDVPDGGLDLLLDRAGEVAFMQEDYSQVVSLVKTLVDRFPQSPWAAGAYLRLSQAYYKAGKDRDAMNAYKEYVRRGGATSQRHDYWEALRPVMIRIQSRLRQAGQVAEQRASLSISMLAGSPWLSMIAQPPVLVVHPQTTSIRFAAWQFTVSNLGGTTWYKATGGSSLPAQFAWDGRLPDGGVVGLGQKFMVTMSLLDTSGKTLYTTTRVSQLNNLAYHDSGGFRIELLAAMLFASGRNGEISLLGQSLMREAGDLVLEETDGKIRIEATAARINDADLRARCVKETLVRNLGLAPEDVQVQARAAAPGFPGMVAIVAVQGGRKP